MPQVSLAEWVAHMRAGNGLGSFPTDTVPALATRPDQAANIYQFKARPAEKPLILMGADLADLLPYVHGTDDAIVAWQRVAEQYWPGALTLVLPASDRVPAAMNPMQTGTLGIRVPNHPVARYLLAQTGPLATTSVNRSGQPPLTDQSAIVQTFPDLWVLTATALGQIEAEIGTVSPAPSQVPSTVVQWQPSGWQIVRQGAIQFPANAGIH